MEVGKGLSMPRVRAHVVAYDYGVKRNILRMLSLNAVAG